MRYRLQRHDGTDCSATMVPFTVLRLVPIQRYCHKYRTVIFVNGCFWHGHEGCRYYVLPKTNVDFWQNKIERNRSRDIEERQRLTSMGWRCITIWECQLKPKVRQQTLEALEYTLCHIYLEDRRIKSYETTEEEYNMVAEPVEDYGKSK